MSTVCVNGKELKIFHKNTNGTITLTKPFKPLLNLLYYFPDAVTNSVTGCTLVDDFPLPSRSKSTIHGKSTPSGFLFFSGEKGGPVDPRGIDVDIHTPLLHLEFKWDITTNSPCMEKDIEVRFMSYIESQFFNANDTFPMIDTKNNFTIYCSNKGRFTLPLEWTDQFYVWVNVLCSMVLTVSARVPKPFLMPPKVGRELVTQSIPVDRSCVPVYTLRLPEFHFDLIQHILPDFQKAARGIHDSIVYYSIPYPLTTIPRPLVIKRFETLVYTGGLFVTSSPLEGSYFVGITRFVTKNQNGDIAVPARRLIDDGKFYGIETITPDPPEDFHLEVSLNYHFTKEANPFPVNNPARVRVTNYFFLSFASTTPHYNNGVLLQKTAQHLPNAKATFILQSDALQFGFQFLCESTNDFSPISISTTVVAGPVPPR